MFRFYFIVQIKDGPDERLILSSENILKIAEIIKNANESMEKQDLICDKFIEQIKIKYFRDFEFECSGSGFDVLAQIRDNYYILKLENIEKAKKLLEILDKILYDYRNEENITIKDSIAYIDKTYFAKKVKDFGYDLTAYDLLKDLKF